ncbi:MAG: winged helix-turn-helix transcriptional regulator, partial [Pseudomonadota bacterium]
MSQIDSIDCRLLEQLQRDATISLDALAEESGISLNTVWRRIK